MLTDEMKLILARYAQSLIPDLTPEFPSPSPWESKISKRFVHQQHSSLDDLDDMTHMMLVTY